MVCNRIVARIDLSGGMTDVEAIFTSDFPILIKTNGKIRTPPSYSFWFSYWNTIDLYNGPEFVMKLSQRVADAINEHFNIMGYK